MTSKKVTKTKIGQKSVVVVPLDEWHKIESALEDLEMMQSEKLREDIRKAREDEEYIPLEQVLKENDIKD